MQNIQTAVLPFDGINRHTRTVPEGLNLQEIKQLLAPDVLGATTVAITINGERMPECMWSNIKPKQNAIVGVMIVPAGSKKSGGGKNPLATIISVVTLIAAPYLAGAFASSLALGIFGTGVATAGQVAFASGLIRVGVSLVGFMVTSSLSSAPSQSTAQSGNSSSVRESPTQFIEGAENAIDPWGVVPINLGVNRMIPKQAAVPYTESVSDSQYVRQLFTYGYGQVQIEDEKIGDTLLTNFSNIDQENKLNGDLSSGTNLYTNDVDTFETNQRLTTSYSRLTTAEGVDEAVMDITFVSGLVLFRTSDGARLNRSVQIEYRYKEVGSATWIATPSFTVTANKTSVVRNSQRIVFPSRGQYDIEFRRVEVESDSDRVRDQVNWTALRSIIYQEPVTLPNISGKAIRIKATDQLNGVISRYNAIVKTKVWDYDVDTNTWTWRVSSNPASIYRHVLQSEAFVKRLSDSQIDLDALKEWHIYCESLNLEYNRIIDYETDVETVLNDIAAAGFASKYNVDGIYSVVVDNTKPIIKGLVTPKNSWGYKGGISYPELPHGLIVEFRNKDKGYAIDERVIYTDGYDSSNATLYERIEFSSCTNSDLAYIYGRRYLSNVKLQPEIHTFYQDPEFLTLRRGDRFKFVNDSILVGVGSGRISSLTYDDPETPTTITGFTLDDTVNIPTVSSFGVRMRYSDASDFAYHALTTTVGETNTFVFTTPVTLTGYVAETDDYLEERQMLKALCAFSELDRELDLIVLSAEGDKNYNAKIKAIDYAPGRFITDEEPIPEFESNVTFPYTGYRPESPILAGDIISDESAMVINSDGSYLSRMIIPLTNVNEDSVLTLVKSRSTGETQWSTPEILSRSPNELTFTGLQDGALYDFDIFYQRQGGNNLLSNPLQLRNQKFVGGSTPPDDVATFRIDVADDNVAILSWLANDDIDLSHYQIRYSSAYTGAAWGTSQILEEFVYENRYTLPFRGGTYFIKALDLLGNQSENATQIITYDPGEIRNVIEVIDEHPGFAGTTDNVSVIGSTITLTDVTADGYYYFVNRIDLGYVDRVFLSSTINAYGQYINNVFDFVDVFAVSDVFPSGDDLDVFGEADIFAIEDLFGIGTDAWTVSLEYRTTDDDPAGAPTWTAWETLTAGFKEFRAVEFRLLMQSTQSDITPTVDVLSVTADVPDRNLRGKDITVPIAGYSLAYDPQFAVSPTVLITLQDSVSGDEVEFVSKTSSGFEFKVYNSVSASYVERTFDYAVLGYGRKN